jgi:hypothetical protein
MSKSHWNSPEYQRRHAMVRRVRGKASDYTCSCGSPAAHWATLPGLDGSKPEHYSPMCRSCHRREHLALAGYPEFCTICGDPVHAEGKCNNCYHRTRRNAANSGKTYSSARYASVAEAGRRRIGEKRSEATRQKMRSSQQARRQRERLMKNGGA